MKHFKVIFPFIFTLILTVFAGSNEVYAQLNCDISIASPMPVCPDIDFELSAQYYDNCTYTWKKNGEVLDNTGNTIITSTHEQATYTLTVINTNTQEQCDSDPFVVTVHTPIEISFNQVQLTCTNGDNDNGNSAKVKAIASGEFQPEEYHYFWKVSPLQIAPGDSSLAIGLKAHQKYAIEVRDNYGCPAWDTIFTKAYDNPVIEITTDPDTAYIENPVVNFSFENLSEDTVQVSNHFWDYGDCFEGSPIYPLCLDDPTTRLDAPTHTYSNPIYRDTTYIASLTVYNQQGCDTIYTKDVTIRLVNLFIPNVFTPNGDGINDTFIITENTNSGGGGERVLEYENYDVLAKYYQSSKLVVFNRWGRVVYESSNYQNDWDGDNLPDGVYFYVLKCHGLLHDEVVYKGSVTIFGSNN
jgi:hypothetical protein